jgi:tripartite-type tricarboxylate transporter receptor subunit TctC
MLKTTFCRLLLACVACGAVAAHAGDYPERPIRLIIPFPPGGATDFAGRLASGSLTELLGQQIVVDNRGGASGVIGTELAARADPDGYTLFLGNVNAMAINPHIQRMKVDPLKDLTPVGPLTNIPTVIVGNAGVTGNTLKEFVEHALKSKREIRYGTATLSSPGRFIMVAFFKSLGLKILEVPYNGAGPATIGLLAGEMEILPVTVASLIGLVKTGKIKPLAVTSKTRVALVPNVPTMPELGYPDIIMGQWNGVFAPTGLPRNIALKLHKAATDTMKRPQIVKRLTVVGAEAFLSESPEEFGKYVLDEHTRWGKIIRDSGIAVK